MIDQSAEETARSSDELTRSASVVALAQDLAWPERRERARGSLRAVLGIDDLLIFVPDPELGQLLPAPGFPQTLPNARAWRSFLQVCRDQELVVEVLPVPGFAEPRRVWGYRVERGVIAFLGALPPAELRSALLALAPLLIIALERESAIVVAERQVAVARTSASEARELARALDRSQRELQAALRETSHSRQRLDFLAAASTALASSLDVRRLVRQASLLLVPELSDTALIYLMDDSDRPCLAGLASRDEPSACWRPASAEAGGSSNVGAPWFAPRGATPDFPAVLRLDPRQLARLLATGELLEPLAAFPTASVLIAALPGTLGGASSPRSAGLLVVSRGTRREPFVEDDLALLSEFARRVALCLDNARLFQATTRAVQARDDFLSVAAHELKTPLTVLRSTAQLLIRVLDHAGGIEPARLHRSLESLVRQSQRLGQLTEQLLDVTRLETGQLSMRVAPTELEVLVRDAVERIQLQYPERLIVADLVGLTVPADSLRIEQVLMNLLDNAVKYSPSDVPIEVGLTRSDAWAVLRVRDHGGGIDPDQREKIFDRFYRATSDVHTTGLGLGLYLSSQIAELHHGTLVAEFPDGGGTEFVLRLPLGS